MRRKFYLALMAGSAAAVAVGGINSQIFASTAAKPAVITVWLPAPNPGTPVVESPLEFAAALWNKQHPTQPVKLNINQAIPFSAFLAKLNTAFVGNNPPDISYGAAGWPYPEARGGYLAAINQLTPAWVHNVYDKYFFSPLRAQMPVFNGNLYAIPTQSGGIDGLWFRKDWFAKAHLPMPNTWAALLHDAQYFHQPKLMKEYKLDASFMLAATATQPMQTGYEGLGFIYAAGGHVVYQNKVTVDSSPVIKALTFLRSLATQNLLPRLALTTDATTATALLATGKIPMMIGGTWQYIALQQDANLSNQQMKTEFQWIPFPRMNAHSTTVTSTTGANNLMIAKSPVDKLAAQIVELSLTPQIVREEAAAQRAMIAKDGIKAAPSVQFPSQASEIPDMVGPAPEIAFIRSTIGHNMQFARQSLSFTYGASVQTAVGKLIEEAVFGNISPAQAAQQAKFTLENETGLQ